MDHLKDDEKNPDQNVATISAGAMGNCFSAQKWWHKYEALSKTSWTVPSEIDEVIKRMIKSYKKDIGEKRRVSVLPRKEGKSGLSLAGYMVLRKFFALF